MGWLKKSGWIFGIVIIVCLIICIFPWRHKIDTTIQGIQCRMGDEDYSEDVSINVKGVYKNYLIKNDSFEGTISIDSYDFTLGVPIIPTQFSDGYANLQYEGKNYLEFYIFGFFICTPNFDKLLIGVHEPIEGDSKSWSGENGLIICAPAKNRIQAVEIAKILSRKSKWLSHADWCE
jgi:hypothetical protein